MTAPQERVSNSWERRTLLVMLAVASLALGAILLPFSGTLLWSVIIAMLFTPLYRRLLRRMRGRRSPAALVTLLVVLVIAILPFAFITGALVGQVTSVYAAMQSGAFNPSVFFQGVVDALPNWAVNLLERYGLVEFDDLQRRVSEMLGQGSKMIAAQALSIGQNTFEFVARLFIMLYITFFLIRDGDRVMRSIRDAVPLRTRDEQVLIDKFTTVIRATVKGNLLVAVLQGALGGIAFWFLGIEAALLWAVLMAFLSLLPAVGAALVWLPVALYFLSTGAVAAGVGLVAYGILVIGLVDNVLRPVLVGKDTRMPDWVVLITTLGGMAVFGINGFVLGPVIAAMFFSVWHIAVTSPAYRDAPSSDAVRARAKDPID